MKTNFTEQEKSQLALYNFLVEGLKQIEERSQTEINKINAAHENEKQKDILSVLHFSRLQARGMLDKVKANNLNFAHIYNAD